MSIIHVPVSPAKKICTSMSQERQETTQASSLLPSKDTESLLFSVSCSPLSSASSMTSDDELLKTDCLEDPKKGFCLYDETWPCGNPDYPNATSCAPRNEELTKQTRKIKEMRFLSKEQKEEEERYGVLTDLTLFTDPWTIKTVLDTSDIGKKLRLGQDDVDRHILRYLSEYDQKKFISQGDGITVNVYDHDMHTTHKINLTRWYSKHSYRYRLKDWWLINFVNRRGLKKGDEIGLFWDRFHYKLHFRVLSRANAKAPAEENELLSQ